MNLFSQQHADVVTRCILVSFVECYFCLSLPLLLLGPVWPCLHPRSHHISLISMHTTLVNSLDYLNPCSYNKPCSWHASIGVLQLVTPVVALPVSLPFAVTRPAVDTEHCTVPFLSPFARSFTTRLPHSLQQ